MSTIFHGLIGRAFVAMLVVLGLDAVSLFVIFNFVAATQFGVETGLILFLASTLLLIFGYFLGILVVGFLAIFVLARFWTRTGKTETS